MSLQSTTEPIYSNHILLAPDGTMLCRMGVKKSQWYMDRNLVDIVCEDPLTLRLKFEPKGRGNQNDDFHLGDKENVCVRCGTDEGLTMHHIVPRCFRRWFSDGIKSHESHDVLPLCVSCHTLYETKAQELKTKLCKQYDVNPQEVMTEEQKELHHTFGYAKALRDFRDKIPSARVTWLEEKVKGYLQSNDLAEEALLGLAKQSRRDVREPFGKEIVDKLDSIQDFVVQWRRHFMEVMQPKFMPPGWKIDRKIRDN